MTDYSISSHELKPVEGDNQIELQWTNPNQPALESLYGTMHGDREGYEDYLASITEEGLEERKGEILARREANPEPMATFALETLDGDEITSEGLLGKVLVINFWGTW